MFIYSVKASTLRFAAIVVIGVSVFGALFFFIPPYEQVSSASVLVSYDKVKTNEDRVELLSSLGYSVSAEPVQEVKVRIPSEFDRVYASYNEMQRSQGFDLSRYKNKEVERYTYVVTNYEGYDGTVYANLLVYRSRVIGGDICSADTAGFVHGLEKH